MNAHWQDEELNVETKRQPAQGQKHTHVYIVHRCSSGANHLVALEIEVSLQCNVIGVYGRHVYNCFWSVFLLLKT